MTPSSYIPTTTGIGLNLDREEATAASQESIILGMYYTHRRPMTANDVHTIWSQRKQDIGQPVPILTSVRRALSVLQTRGYLQKQATAKTGPYGKPVHHYTVSDLGLKQARRQDLHRYFQKEKPIEVTNPEQLNLF